MQQTGTTADGRYVEFLPDRCEPVDSVTWTLAVQVGEHAAEGDATSGALMRRVVLTPEGSEITVQMFSGGELVLFALLTR